MNDATLALRQAFINRLHTAAETSSSPEGGSAGYFVPPQRQ